MFIRVRDEGIEGLSDLVFEFYGGFVVVGGGLWELVVVFVKKMDWEYVGINK